MSVLDQTNVLELDILQVFTVTTMATHFTPSLDFKNFDGGIIAMAFTKTTVTQGAILTLQDSPDDSVWTDIPEDKLIDPAGNGNIFLDTSQLDNAPMKRIGAFSVNQFIRFKTVSLDAASLVIHYMFAREPNEIPPAI